MIKKSNKNMHSGKIKLCSSLATLYFASDINTIYKWYKKYPWFFKYIKTNNCQYFFVYYFLKGIRD